MSGIISIGTEDPEYYAETSQEYSQTRKIGAYSPMNNPVQTSPGIQGVDGPARPAPTDTPRCSRRYLPLSTKKCLRYDGPALKGDKGTLENAIVHRFQTTKMMKRLVVVLNIYGPFLRCFAKFSYKTLATDGSPEGHHEGFGERPHHTLQNHPQPLIRHFLRIALTSAGHQLLNIRGYIEQETSALHAPGAFHGWRCSFGMWTGLSRPSTTRRPRKTFFHHQPHKCF